MCVARDILAPSRRPPLKAAVVRAAGLTPVYDDFAEPTSAPGENRIAVTAAALSPLARSRAAGAHYSASGGFPAVVGVDGVGRLDDGRRVYFLLPRPPWGAMAERAVAPAAQIAPLPDGLDDATAAAIANPGMSSWAAFKERAKLKAGETVLINGATGSAGRLAVQIARRLGAKTVIATGRNPDALRALAALGADATIPFGDNEAALEDRFRRQFAEGVDVVVDYLWGKSAERLLVAAAKGLKEGASLRFVHVGAASGPNIALPGAVLRSKAITLMGSGLGSVPLDRLTADIGELLQAAATGGFTIPVKAVPLSDVGRAWGEGDGAGRIVFTIGAR
jgi:NADPH:quinone reductase-like Zn-dependent oxidoreductase